MCEFGHWVCRESRLAIKDLQPTTSVLKAGHLVSCSSLCVLCVVCLVCTVWFVEVRFLGLSLFFLLLLGWCAIHMFFLLKLLLFLSCGS